MTVTTWLRKRFGWSTKWDANEYARLFLSGADLPDSVAEYTPEGAMRISAVYACVKILSSTIASLPLKVYRRISDNESEEAKDHPAYALLYQRPNRYHNAFEFVEQAVAHIALRGNHVSLKVRDGKRVKELIPVHPSRVTLEQYNNALIYRIDQRNGQQIRVLSEDVLHVRGLAVDGYWGLSPVAQAKDTFELARRIQKYGNSVFESGGSKRVMLRFPHALDRESKDALREAWERVGKNSARTMVLDDGGDAVTVGMNADEAQYLETRQMTIADIARIYTMPLVLLNVHDKTASYASTEQFDLMFAKHTIRPWCTRIERAIDRDIIADPDYYCKFNMDALLRGDAKTRTEAGKTEFMHGKISLNEWRRRDDLNPIAMPEADMHFVPNNLTPIERLAERPESTPAAPDADPAGGGVGGEDNEPKLSLSPIARDIAQRLVKAEIRGARSCRDFEEFRTRQRHYAYRAFGPLFEAAGLDDDDRRASLATELTARLTEGREIDVTNREMEIYAMLMSVVTSSWLDAAKWMAQSVEAAKFQTPAADTAAEL